MIALLHGAPAFGAVERYIAAVARGLRESGWPAALVHPDAPSLEPFAALGGEHLRLVRIPAGLAAPALVARLVGVLRELRPRVVHVTDVWPPALVAARLAVPRSRLLLTHHTPALPRRDNFAGKLLLRLGWLMRPGVIYTSETDRAADRRRLLRTHVVALGIDVHRFRDARPVLPKDGPVIGNVARLAQQKDHWTLLEAAALVLERRPDARFVIVGEGELRDALEQRARELAIADRVLFAGARDDVPELLASFDVFAFPSLFEGLCLAVIEAQAAGVPVVATPVGGIRETVVPGETGTLVPVGDATALAGAILAVLDRPPEVAAMAEEAQRRVLARYSEERMVKETLALYS